ncbi:M10 family metallopeptidase C-terminal domain-containing protein [Phenylobacterium sp. J367]|uniref:M10 family metallopeptidase C-terminal domain-containing protein n=1 Tax=Phenylobacterium sp. J367 TaxID=2898435 RepID=UPI00215112CF|nr:M10 family metallopeptidase C-terminal domain-containing protein [Phenylobacterium sp. J367]MCR5879336.1 M10 family metallopeptidase C-terminal domain-containing protein [Phenylobacterium sp. J367]
MPAPAYAIAAVQTALPVKLDPWAGAAGTLTITYAFENEQSSEFLRSYSGWAAWTDAEKEAVRQGLREYESVVDVRFVEVLAGPTDPMIAFGRVDVASVAETWWKISYGTDATGQLAIHRWDAGVVFDNGRDLTLPNAQWLILHEIGHAMMMKHTGDYDTTGKATAGPFLPVDEDNRDHTVMSYVWNDGAAPSLQLQLYDIAALQARWGANTTEAAGDSVYSFDTPGVFAIWDTGGTDRIEAGSTGGAVAVDLNEGEFSQLDGQNRISIAWGAKIEEAAGGASDDRLRGNDLDNRLTGGSGGDTIEGGAGLDYLRGEAGDDSIVGGAGFDDAHGNMGNDTVRGGDGDDWVVGGKDQDQLFGEAGFDIVYGNLGDDTCEGGDGGDWVRGGQGNDLVLGGDGADWLWGDRGDDTVTGGGGADDFHLQAGCAIDRVTDFSLAEGDRVFVDGAAGYTVSLSGADTVIDLGDGDRMILVGVQLSAGAWLVVS